MNGRGGRQFYRGGGTQALTRNLDELTKSFQGQKTDIDEIKNMFMKLTTELDQVKARVRELESSGNNLMIGTANKTGGGDVLGASNMKNNNAIVKQNNNNNNGNHQQSNRDHQQSNHYKRYGRNFNRRYPHYNRRNGRNNNHYNNQQQQQSQPVNQEANEDHKQQQQQKPQEQQKQQEQQKDFPKLSDSELNELVQALKREFLNEPNNMFKRSLRKIRSTINDKGPKVVYEFVASILDHALCDVTSPTKLSKIANRFYQLLVSEDNTDEVDFQNGFFDALNNISKREDDIAIDAPRYMDTLGQVLAECIVPMNCNKHRHLIKSFINKCLDSYNEKNRAVLLASIMRSIASVKTDQFARTVWDIAHLDWTDVLQKDVDGINLDEFLESNDVEFTTKAFSPKPHTTNRKNPKELERFADDVTTLVERRCTCQTLVDLVKELNLEKDEKIDYLGTLIYAIIRGCLSTDTGAYKLNNEALNKYSTILTKKHEDQEAIALHALTALTKLWHHYNCPQDLLRTILLALHNHGTAPYAALDNWLNSESLTNIPGIGAARLNSKRYIEDLGANLKQNSN